MDDFKCEINAHVWGKNICILKAQYGCLEEWYVRKELHLPILSEYHGCMVDSILKSHEFFFVNDSLRGMCYIPSRKSSINRRKSGRAMILFCHDKRQMILPLRVTWEWLWTIMSWLILK